MATLARLSGLGAIIIIGSTVAGAAPSLAEQPGFYLRTDTGKSWARDAGFREDNPSDPNCFLFIVFPGRCGDVLDHLGSSSVLGGGIGYRFTDMFRGDITITGRGGYNINEADIAGTAFKANVQSTAVLFNGFVDGPMFFERVRPFVGAGIGFSRNKVSNIEWNGGGTGVINGGRNTDFAFQLMAGAAVHVVHDIFVDVGYRYFDGGEFKKETGADVQGVFNASGITSSATGDLAAHEIMINLRVPLSVFTR